MPTASNMSELKKMLMDRLETAMEEVAEKALAEMEATAKGFYSGSPKKYKRTGALAETPRVSDIMRGGDSVSVEAKLDTSGGYTTGSNPSMGTVLNWALTKEAGLVGGPLEWDNAKQNMKKILESTIRKHFK